MFHVNKFETINNQAFPYAKTVTEIKAPTDDSIRLYGEMLDKARKELVIAYNIDNDIKLSVNCYTDHTDSHLATYKLNINGKEINGNIRLYDRIEEVRMEYSNKDVLYNLIKERIAMELVEAFLHQLK